MLPHLCWAYKKLILVCYGDTCRSFIFGTKLAGSCEGGDEGCLMESSRGWPTQSHSTSTDPHLQGAVRSPSPPTTDVYISNVMFDNSIIWPSFYLICYVISRFYQIKIKRSLQDRHEGGDVSYMFVDETALGTSSDCSHVVYLLQLG